jgi:hypothetical protein
MTDQSWISVSVLRPPTTEPIIYSYKKNNGKWAVGIAYWTKSNKWSPEINTREGFGGFTHWKPLGDPPTDRTVDLTCPRTK